MLIRATTDIDVRAAGVLRSRIEATLRYRLARFSRSLARVEVHVGWAAGNRARGANRCAIRVSPDGLAPHAVANEGLIFEHALSGAATKTVAALDRLFARFGSTRSS